MENEKIILHLDDDRYLLREMADYLRPQGYQLLSCPTVAEAEAELAANPQFVIVDLFLDGDSGDVLSNNFIQQSLIPRGVKYGRMTSAPHLVPQEFAGDWILDKRRWQYNQALVLPLLIQSLQR